MRNNNKPYIFFRSIGVILAFDLTKRETFKNILKWQNEVLECTHENIELVLVGNKLDLEEEFNFYLKEKFFLRR